jgi:deoxyribose-phosphate aldolase
MPFLSPFSFNLFPVCFALILSPAPYIDHTLLKADATADDIRRLCEEAVEHGFAAICIAPVFVRLAADLLYGSDVATATVIGFPLGYQTTEVKVFEAGQAVAAGAGEIDMVIHLGMARQGCLDQVEDEIGQVVRGARPAKVKVIIECALLDDPLKQALTARVVTAGAAYVKTSTGFAVGGASEADVRLLAESAAGRIGVKAAGGIRDWAFCLSLLQAGATRIGSSNGLTILRQWQEEQRG